MRRSASTRLRSPARIAPVSSVFTRSITPPPPRSFPAVRPRPRAACSRRCTRARPSVSTSTRWRVPASALPVGGGLAVCDLAQAPRALGLDRRRHGIGRGVRGARPRRVREDVHAREPGLADGRKRAPRNAASVLGRVAHDDVGGQVHAGNELPRAPDGGQEPGRRVAAPHRPQHAVVARLHRHVQVARHARVRHRVEERVRHVVHLDRREPHPLDPARRPAAATSRSGRRIPAGRSRKQPRLMPVRTTSRWPCRARRATSASTSAAARLRLAPRTCGITQ